MATHILTILALFLALNALAFLVYFLDKQAARNRRRRISERTLLTLALIGGSLGAVCAQKLLRHKTQKEPFRSLLKAIIVFHATSAILLSAVAGYMILELPLLD
ncbi:DUF1294 domain-containing protein [Rhizobium grahamii]|uniref:DUF1294 domain-containing protein n=2 Tax=Rhizobium grahamii TaxID=1120045 RepID=A0A5Q0C1X8_9HYPH|nr:MULTISPECIES: DUF1294 domain-containing protein [Rhizobium]QFY59878.1 DUF1294 domain-containing protein [Rhizobium grahamii]QRM51005.1 DUF1294 domain-containing protein [Rhizobium sp. BG6]